MATMPSVNSRELDVNGVSEKMGMEACRRPGGGGGDVCRGDELDGDPSSWSKSLLLPAFPSSLTTGIKPPTRRRTQWRCPRPYKPIYKPICFTLGKVRFISTVFRKKTATWYPVPWTQSFTTGPETYIHISFCACSLTNTHG